MIPKEYPPTMKSNAQPQDFNSSTAGPTTSVDYNTNWCPHKLPCGWCSYMSRPCIKDGSPTITWTNAQSGSGYTVKGEMNGVVHGAVHGGEV